MLTVNFDDLEAVLSTVDAPYGAAEAHGSLCGALATVPGLSADDWIGPLMPADADGEDALRSRNLLETVFEETRESLGSPDMDFTPILPDDEQPLERRVAALADWCGGYLFGIGSGELPPTDELPEEVAEVLKDFGEFSRATTDSGETEESSETSYAEIVEHIRAGAQLAYMTLAPQRERVDRP